MEDSNVLDNVQQTVATFGASLKNFFGQNPYVYSFLLIVVFIYGSQYVPMMPRKLSPLLNNPVAHFLYFYLVCVLIAPDLAVHGAVVAALLTLVLNFITDGSVKKVVKASEEEEEEEMHPHRGRMLQYEEEEEEGSPEEAEEEHHRRAVEEEYKHQMASAQQGRPVEEGPVAVESGNYAAAY